MTQRTANQGDTRPERVAVAVDVPLRQVFDYLPLPGEPPPAPGSRVRVPFGRRSEVGLVWPAADRSNYAGGMLRRITASLDREPLLGSDDLALLRFAASYYHHAPGEVCAAALPPRIRQGLDMDAAADLVEDCVALTPAGREALDASLRKRAPKQYALLATIAAAAAPPSSAALNDALPGWRRVLQPLLKRGWLAISERRIEQDWRLPIDTESPPTLNDEQRAALAAIESDATRFAATLLDGVTGSGKTEIFLRLAASALARDRQVLVLVPEIGLTPQLVRRFERRLGVRVALLHSNLSDTARASAWLAARNGLAPVVVGTRSAVFTPLARPGLIIVDEEHDPSLKQQEGFRYHARDLAVWRAQRQDVPIILGSATPSLESLHNARTGRYRHVRLRERAGAAVAPAIRVIDSQRFHLVDGLSQPVIDAMRAHLDNDQQVLVFLNRRGFAPTVLCSDCGAMADCADCDAHMTLHAGRARLQCHHCGAARPLQQICDACGGTMKPLGEGTERVEAALTELFPAYTIARIDSDTTQTRTGMTDALAAARDGRTRIMVGTQMLAKGHHFPALTLVVVLNADQGFFASDFRAGERLAQSLLQVAGRAGRATHRGEVLIQSAFAHHALLNTLVADGYHAFATAALREREQAGWPPFSHIAVLHAAAPAGDDAQSFLRAVQDKLRAAGVNALGPAPAAMLRRAGRYRYQLMLRAETRSELQRGLALLDHALDTTKRPRNLRHALDVDPQTDV